MGTDFTGLTNFYGGCKPPTDYKNRKPSTDYKNRKLMSTRNNL